MFYFPNYATTPYLENCLFHRNAEGYYFQSVSIFLALSSSLCWSSYSVSIGFISPAFLFLALGLLYGHQFHLSGVVLFHFAAIEDCLSRLLVFFGDVQVVTPLDSAITHGSSSQYPSFFFFGFSFLALYRATHLFGSRVLSCSKGPFSDNQRISSELWRSPAMADFS